jgi:hypothetical protein
MLRRKVCALFIITSALIAEPVLAQQPEHEQHHPSETPPAAAMPGPGAPGGGMAGTGGMPMMRMMMGQDGMGGMSMMMAGHIEGRLAFLKTELKITDAQLPLWNAVAEVIRANAKSMSEMSAAMMGGAQTSATLPEKLATREKMLTVHLEALRKLQAAVEPLYASFSDEQKKAADELMLGPMGMM